MQNPHSLALPLPPSLPARNKEPARLSTERGLCEGPDTQRGLCGSGMRQVKRQCQDLSCASKE
jgi:hypothetical protein